MCHVVILPGGGVNAKGRHAKSAKTTVCSVLVWRPLARAKQNYDRCMTKISHIFRCAFLADTCRRFAWRGRNVAFVLSFLRIFTPPCRRVQGKKNNYMCRILAVFCLATPLRRDEGILVESLPDIKVLIVKYMYV